MEIKNVPENSKYVLAPGLQHDNFGVFNDKEG